MSLQQSKHLCVVCRGLDLPSYFQHARDSRKYGAGDVGATPTATKLGSSDEIHKKSSCFSLTTHDQASQYYKTTGQKPPDFWLFSYLYAFDIFGNGATRKAYRIGIASRTGNEAYHVRGDHVGDIQLLAPDAKRLFGTYMFYGRAIPPSTRVNTELIQEWLLLCEGNHLDLCEKTGPITIPRPERLMMVDVKHYCICTLPENGRYLALSYCWPVGETFKLCQAILKDLQRPGALKATLKELPGTIQDAINLVRDLGESYLWVDALCIIQDDEDYKRFQLTQMDRVYSSAIVTIVCAAETQDSVRASSGLPCYRDKSRIRTQEVFEVDGLHLTVPFEAVVSLVQASRWASRAWTYQELLLSKRLLFFTDTQVYFQCRSAVFCEDGCGEDARAGAYISPLGNMWNHGGPYTNEEPGYLFGALHLLSSHASPTAAVKDYTLHVTEYTVRQMTEAHDVLNAFIGIQNIMQKTMSTDFFYGLPLRYIDKCILWTQTAPQKRRKSPVPSSMGKHEFPSWSWMGWEGIVEMMSYIPVENVRTEAAWYLIRSKGEKTRIRVDDLVGTTTFPQQGNKDVGTSHSAKDNIVAKLSRAYNPDTSTALEEESRDTRLACWSAIAEFRIDGKTASLDNHGKVWPHADNLAVSDEHQNWAGSVMLDRKLTAQLLKQHTSFKFEFMLVSRSRSIKLRQYPHVQFFDSTVFPERPWCWLNVMLVERKGDVATRVGAGIIHEDAWVKANANAIFLVLE